MPPTIKPFFPGRLNLDTRTRQGLQQFRQPQDDGRGGLPSGMTAARQLPGAETPPIGTPDRTMQDILKDAGFEGPDSETMGDPFRRVEDTLPPLGGNGDDLGDGGNGGAGESLFQIEIPEELRRQAEEGIGREAGRAEFIGAGSEIAGEAGRAQRELRGQPFLQGASASGFAQQRVRQVTIQKNKALQRLAIGIESKSEQVRRQALDELKATEFLNEQIKRDFENRREQERLDAEVRRQRLEAALAQFQAQHPGFEEQLASFFTSAVPSIAISAATGGVGG